MTSSATPPEPELPPGSVSVSAGASGGSADGIPSGQAGVRPVLLVLAGAALLRLLALRLPLIWYDEATSGLLGLAVLRGELPVYFFGQSFMGALDGYLAAPLYVVLGVSAGTLKLLTVLVSLVWLGLVVRLAWEAFGPRAALFAAALLAVPPDFLLYWSHQARAHYPLSMTLGTLALLVALRAPRRDAHGTLAFALVGLALGLGFWTNFLVVVYGPPVLVLLLRRGWRNFWPRALAGIPAFVVGSLPHWLYGVAHGTALPPPGRGIPAATVWAHLVVVARASWPIVAGIPAGLPGRAAGVGLAVLVALADAALLVGAACALRRRGPPARSVGFALALLALVNVGVAVGTEYGRMLDDRDQKYLLPLYTALPPLLGAGLVRLARPVGVALTAGLLLIQGSGALMGSLRDLFPGVAAAKGVELEAERATLRSLDRMGPHRLYSDDPGRRSLTFLSGERVIFSNRYEEVLPRYARAVDGAADAGWWSDERSPVLEANFAALGLRFDFEPRGPLGGAYTRFVLAAPPVRELDPAAFRVTASESAAAAGRVLDREAGTLWGTDRRQRGGEWLTVDLGTVAPVALVRWLPGTYQEVPAGVALDASVDGRVWTRLIELPRYIGPLYWSAGHPMGRVRSGRVELRVPPTPTRYLRIVQTGREARWPWTIRELFVYVPAGNSTARPDPDGATLAQALREAGLTRVYADHGWGSRIALADPSIRVVPANRFLDAYGRTGSMRDLLPRVSWMTGTGALLEPGDAEGFARTGRAGGLGFTQRPVAGLVLFAHAPPPPLVGTPLPSNSLRVTASRHPDRARGAIDGEPGTRWTTAHPRSAGDWFRIDLPGPRRVRALRLWTSNPTDLPEDLGLDASLDGVAWRRLAAERRTEGGHRWGGIALLKDGVTGVTFDFEPIVIGALRLTLTRGHPVFDWSIHELTVYGAP